MKKITNLLVITFLLIGIISIKAQNYPLSDPSNNDGWILNSEMSDEFNGTTLDKTKWWILGENNDYRNKWKGRAPGQYSGNNVEVTGGDLIIKSKWEPSFNFANEINNGYYYGGSQSSSDKSRPITQACILSEKFFKYGYMEIRCKSADAPVTNAFWTTGYHSEIDMTENYGKRPIGNPQSRPESLERRYRSNIISWDPEVRDTGNFSYHTEHTLAQRTASNYFVYGFEWDKDFMKIYFNGTLLETKTRNQLENNDGIPWSWDFPQELWIDSEVFYWYGLPSINDLASDAEFRIDYVRIWQKELLSGDDFNAQGFEGPFYFSGRSRNWFAANSTPWRMKDEKPNNGDFSLSYNQTSTITSVQTMFSPYGSLNIPSGANKINMNIWIDPSTNINELTVFLENPFKRIDIDVSGVTKGTWVPISGAFSRSSASNTNTSNGDRIRLQVRPEDVSGSNVLFYIDDIIFDSQITLSNDEVSTPLNFSIYPNPAKETITINSENNSAISIVNSLGVVIKSIKNAKKSQMISVNDLASGIYFISVKSKNKTATKKLIIK